MLKGSEVTDCQLAKVFPRRA